MLIIFAIDTELYETDNNLGDGNDIQNNFYSLEKWAKHKRRLKESWEQKIKDRDDNTIQISEIEDCQ